MVSRVIILGATGSVGSSALAVIKQHPQLYKVVGLAANKDVNRLAKLCQEFKPARAVLAKQTAAAELQKQIKSCEVRGGEAALTELAASGADIVICAVAGAAGLHSTLAAIKQGGKILIANKEPLVMLGRWICEIAAQSGAMILPIDSEHNAIFQCIPNVDAAAKDARGIRRIILTASGGPFWKTPVGEFKNITAEMACQHPVWQMGKKISVDSATMMNKGLELIEACEFFKMPANAIDILIHRQSLVHAMVEYTDGTTLAHFGRPDMRIPIANALGYPKRINSGVTGLELTDFNNLEFEKPDDKKFPAINLARAVAARGGTMPAIFNAANEEAVRAFLDAKLSFDKIVPLVEEVVTRADNFASNDCDLENALAADAQARRVTIDIIAKV